MLPIWYHSEETGAPTLNNAAGSLIAVLDALLTTGFNVKAVTSVSVSGGVATAVISAHGYEVGKTLLISGATPSGLNGNQVITAAVDSNTVQWLAAGVPDGVATGSITSRRAPLGWVKAFAGANKAIYQRTDLQATSMLWRVDDTGTGVASSTYARALMVETAGGVDTYTGMAPQAAHLAGGVYISKGDNSVAAKKWILIGDGKTIWFFSDDGSYSYASHGGLHGSGFGDINSWRSSGDAYGCMVWGSVNNYGLNYINYAPPTVSNSDGIYMARPTNHVGGSVGAGFRGRISSVYVGQSVAQHAPYPSPVDGGLAIETAVLVPEYVASGSQPFRGVARGLGHPLGAVGGALHKQLLTNLVGSPDTWLCVAVTTNGATGALLFNVTSDWG